MCKSRRRVAVIDMIGRTKHKASFWCVSIQYFLGVLRVIRGGRRNGAGLRGKSGQNMLQQYRATQSDTRLRRKPDSPVSPNRWRHLTLMSPRPSQPVQNRQGPVKENIASSPGTSRQAPLTCAHWIWTARTCFALLSGAKVIRSHL